MLVKLMAFGQEPELYFADAWNKLDSFVVFVGFVEMTPGRVVFEAFPVVVLRLLRLLRVFRLAKAFPRLRSIVEALMSGFAAVSSHDQCNHHAQFMCAATHGAVGHVIL